MLWKNVVVCALFSGAATAQSGPTIGGCPVFPSTNVWNQPVDTLPVHSLSATYINAIGPSAVVRMDDVLPINVVPSTQPEVPVNSLAVDESDKGGYAIPPNPQIEPGSDAHILVVKQGVCILYELITGTPSTQGPGWDAFSAAKWDLNSNALRPDGWTSADAAGLPMTPGVLRYDEVAAGAVKHALRFTAPNTPYSIWVWPARHYASHKTDTLPPFGTRIRLKASFDTAGYPQRLQVIMQGLKKYGAILSDNGLPMAFQHDTDPRWDANELLQMHTILHGSDFEVVDESELMSDSDSGQATPPVPAIFVTDLLGRRQAAPLGPGISIVNGTVSATGGGAVSSVAGKTGDVSLSVGDINGLSAALGAKEQALSFAAPLVRTGDTVSCPTCGGAGGVAPGNPGSGGGSASSGTAAFSRADTTTMGGWKGVYGGAGYNIAGDSSSYPGYAAVRVTSDAEPLIWAQFTSDARALQTAVRPSFVTPDGVLDRIAAALTSASSVAVDVNFADTDTHQVALYLLDWDSQGRVEKVEVVDANNAVLDTRSVNAFSSGQYLVWKVAGHVKFRVSAQTGGAVLSGFFIDR